MPQHTDEKFSDKIKEFLQREKPMKSIFSTVTFDDKLLRLSGEAQREPWKDLWMVSPAYAWFYFCNKISLTIKNEGVTPLDTDNSKQPLVLNIDVKGTPNAVELLEQSAHNPELAMDVKDGNIVLEHVQINSGESLKLIFLAWFAVHVSEL